MQLADFEIFFLGFLLLTVHIIFYFLYIRNNFRTEMAIFLYFFLYYLITFILSCIIFYINDNSNSIAPIILINSVNGIYCLSFLELWSLSQISYSYEILKRVKLGGISIASKEIIEMQNVGDAKRVSRLQSLSNIKILEKNGSQWRLSSFGKFISLTLTIILWLPNLKNRG